jgi:uncharacterized phosphosugar-binding protein
MPQKQNLPGAQAYMDAVRERLDVIASRQLGAIDQAAAAIVEAVEAGGLVYLFGTGHSHMLAEEGHHRAGGLAAVCPILRTSLMLHEGSSLSGKMERMSGLGPAVLSSYRPTAKDALAIFLTAGQRSAGETALAAKDRDDVDRSRGPGLAAQVPPGLRQKLADIADIVLTITA